MDAGPCLNKNCDYRVSRSVPNLACFWVNVKMRALPLGVAAKRSVHYIWYYFSLFLFLSVPHTFLPEGFIVGFRNFAWGCRDLGV